MPKYFFTSDPHFNHTNIIEYSKGPFGSLNEMNKKIIENWNQRVKREDIGIIVGDFMFRSKDFTFEYFNDKLRGNKIFLRGNHDLNNGVKTKITSMVLYHSKQEIFITHRPQDFSNKYAINLVGHVHEKWLIKKIPQGKNREVILYNVGVDMHNFYPVTLDECLQDIQRIRLKKDIDSIQYF